MLFDPHRIGTNPTLRCDLAHRAHVLSAVMLRRGVAKHHDQAADSQRQHQQDDAEAERQGEVALAGIKHDRRGHDAGVMGDVAADDQDRAASDSSQPAFGDPVDRAWRSVNLRRPRRSRSAGPLQIA